MQCTAFCKEFVQFEGAGSRQLVPDTTRRLTVHCTVQCSAVQCSAVQCSAVQCSVVQYSAVQCSAVQRSANVREYASRQYAEFYPVLESCARGYGRRTQLATH